MNLVRMITTRTTMEMAMQIAVLTVTTMPVQAGVSLQASSKGGAIGLCSVRRGATAATVARRGVNADHYDSHADTIKLAELALNPEIEYGDPLLETTSRPIFDSASALEDQTDAVLNGPFDDMSEC